MSRQGSGPRVRTSVTALVPCLIVIRVRYLSPD